MWNGPIELTIDTLSLVLGPTLSVISHNESFLDEGPDSLENSYDEQNMFNIFEHNLRIKKQSKPWVKLADLKKNKKPEQQQFLD